MSNPRSPTTNRPAAINHAAAPATLSPISSSTSSSSASAGPNSPGLVHARQSSIADILIAPPPLSPGASFAAISGTGSGGGEPIRRPSTASSDDSSSFTSLSSTSTNQLPVEWSDVTVGQLVSKENMVFVEAQIPVENAFEILEKHAFTSLPVRKSTSTKRTTENATTTSAENKSVCETTSLWYMFDYADLNAYLLLILGKIQPDDNQDKSEVDKYVADAREGKPVPVEFVAQLGLTEQFKVFSASSKLSQVAEAFGDGIHRIAVEDSNEIIGVLSQRRMIGYIWSNGRLFKSLELLFQAALEDLNIGTHVVDLFTVNGEDKVIDALLLMHTEGISSVAVIDDNKCLLGNISIVDVRLLTKFSQSYLLNQTCKQFLTVILSNRGLVDGKDAFPVFYVTPRTTLGRTIAKLVATKAHRLWIVQSATHSSAAHSPSTPNKLDVFPPGTKPASLLDQKLIGVVSLTDILALLARSVGHDNIDPKRARRERRSSSSSYSRRSVSITRVSS